MTHKYKVQWHTNAKYTETQIQNIMTHKHKMHWHWIQVQWNANLKRLICWFSISQTDTILRYLYQRKHQLSLIQIYILPDNPQTTAHALIGEKDNEISLQISFLCHIYVCSQISSILTEFKAKQAFFQNNVSNRRLGYLFTGDSLDRQVDHRIYRLIRVAVSEVAFIPQVLY